MSKIAVQKNIPKGWEIKRFDDILTLEYGKPLRELDRVPGNIPVFGSNGIVGFNHVSLVNGPGIIVGRKGGAGEVMFSEEDFYPIDTAYYVKTDLNKKFIYYLLINLDLKKLSGGSAVPGLNRNDAYNKKILIPQKEEQKKIAGILSAVDESIQKVDEMITSDERLKVGLIRDLFDFKGKKDTKLMTLGEIGKVSMCKRIFKEETSNIGDIPFYKIGTFGKKPDAFISQELFGKYREKFPFPKIGDVLLSASGTIGRKVKYDGKPAYFQDSNIIWLDHDESKILNNFLFYLYETIRWETSGSTIKRLYNNAFIKKIVPVPPIDKQQQIVDVLSAVDQKILVNKNLKEKLTQLKRGLMSDLLSGKVRTINN